MGKHMKGFTVKCVSLALLFLPTADASCTKELCCTQTITGKCKGNTDSSKDFTGCTGTYKLKPKPETITGDTKEKCCDQKSCADVTCPDTKKDKAAYTWSESTGPAED